MESTLSFERVMQARAAVTNHFIRGLGIEVGAGSRPFPVPDHVQVLYGDIRDSGRLEAYFKSDKIVGGDRVFDAQTMAGFEINSLDFVLSGHVVEHLWDPIGSIVNTISAVKPGGVFILAVPDMRFTFDRDRPETTTEHVLADYTDGGAGTAKQAYTEHLRYCHPIMTGGQHYSEAEIERQASICAVNRSKFDVHVHAWTMAGFGDLLKATRAFSPFEVEFAIPIENENIFVLKKKHSNA
ncbi:methyltransferase domain-containing protein [Methylocystis heyeri]|uniref:Methyltransferase domain-containing protein n=1 Tax=Methylocystis heyeri TaxID=391905 RepID=A0A6B8KJ60_9HYPH|nr:methyltransferase domain-containing protein [Methylocystis heyeri]QGM46598.1 methyltransferase domain-containing protein [Methylocystis heyeri]